MRVFFLSAWFPYPPDNGSKTRAYNLLRVLASYHQVTLLTFDDAYGQNEASGLADLCQIAGVVPKQTFRPRRWKALGGFLSPIPRSVVDTFSSEMAQLVRQELSQNSYDVIVASQANTARYVNREHTPKIFEEVELSVIRDAYFHAPGHWPRLRRWLTWEKAHRYTNWLTQRFDACTVVSEQEKVNLQQAAPDCKRIEVVPNGVDVEYLHTDEINPQPNVLVYNGALTYSANFDAMRFFLSEIWQTIKSAEPTTCLKITGRTDGVGLQDLRLNEGVTLTGYLPDIRPAVAGAWACIVPLRIGGGTRLKILEAMALGTPVISTTKGAEGLEITPEVNILIANDPKEFAAQILRLLRSPELRVQLSRNGRRLVEEKYSWQMIGEKFNQLLESVAARKREEGA